MSHGNMPGGGTTWSAWAGAAPMGTPPRSWNATPLMTPRATPPPHLGVRTGGGGAA